MFSSRQIGRLAPGKRHINSCISTARPTTDTPAACRALHRDHRGGLAVPSILPHRKTRLPAQNQLQDTSICRINAQPRWLSTRTNGNETAGKGGSQLPRKPNTGAKNAENPMGSVIAYVAFGSNMGDRLGYIEEALRRLNHHEHINVLRTSSIRESTAMYVTDMPDFLNGVFEISTTLGPYPLLRALQDIEKSLDRVKVIDKGPRTIDLDILMYDSVKMDDPELTIPHALMFERPFVLLPLMDLLHPDHQIDLTPTRFGPKLTSLTPREAMIQLQYFPNWKPGMEPWKMTDMMQERKSAVADDLPDLVVPLSYSILDETELQQSRESFFKLQPWKQRRRTELMSILNLTPDSFSDGGLHPAGTLDIDALTATVQSHLKSGATIVDVGGQSSRPSAEPVSAEEEIARVLPIIKHITAAASSSAWPPDLPKPIISVDTYRSQVAHAAVMAGATIVNDISAGRLDPQMLPTIGSLIYDHRRSCSIILMHSRGDPTAMAHPPHTTYPPTDRAMIETITTELAGSVQAAVAAGIPRWRILIDPGIGFAKTSETNCRILALMHLFNRSKAGIWHEDAGRETEQMEQRSENAEHAILQGLPLVVGTSRKRFVAAMTGLDPTSSSNMEEREWGTAVTVAASIQGGADIVRVHNVPKMRLVRDMSDAIFRHSTGRR